MQNETLFPCPDPEASGGSRAPGDRPRCRSAQRDQIVLLPTHLDALLPPEHRARLVWEFVAGLDLSAFHAAIGSVEGRAGRPAIDPRILMTLWLYATTEGVGSARALARLCEAHVAYQWICGGVPVSAHTLSDFRTGHGEALDRLLTESLAGFMREGLIDLDRVAQDGMRVRASAGAASFRSRDGLGRCLEQAEAFVKALREEVDQDPAATDRRQTAARERAVREREERVRRALAERDKAAEQKKTAKKKTEARASTTDPESRVMKMPDGGFRPAYNAQLATDATSQLIVGVDVTNAGNDFKQMLPMLEQIQTRLGELPKNMLVDGGFVSHEAIETATALGSTVYAPVMHSKKSTLDPHEPHPRDSEVIAAWRGRMATPEAQALYRDRAATAECVNAIARNRGLTKFLVRGLDKVRTVLLWHVLAHNMLRAAQLRTVQIL